LSWRSAGSVGLGTVWSHENDTGPDDANHSQDGIFILRGPSGSGPGWLEGLSLLDVAPTILSKFGLPVPPDMQGRIIA
jgi:predicted AlkP superfamily phosphohydrolase/phosphomutase